MQKCYYVYILASKRNGTLYVGMTNDLRRRIEEHKSNKGSDFVEEFKVNKLVYYEQTNDVREAISREKQLKNWKRAWKLDLIEQQNPEWKDYSQELHLF